MKYFLAITTLLICSMGVSSQEGTPLPPVEFSGWPFPSELYCQDIIAPFRGPRWQNIQIGISTEQDLHRQLHTFSEFYQESANPFVTSQVTYRIPNEQSQLWELLPSVVDACISDDVIIALRIYINHQVNPITLTELVRIYGRPDAVTWTTNPGTRVVFWFEQGLAATVQTYNEYHAVHLIFYPYQDINNYSNQWPYMYTSLSEDSSHDTSLPSDQNPFDFNEMTVVLESEIRGTIIEAEIQSTNDPRDVDTLSITYACPKDMEPSLGPSWNDITIGVSSHHAIQRLYGVLVVFSEPILAEEGFAYANGITVTTRCDLLSLYLNFVDATNHVHTVDNLIHEFGHIVTLLPPVGRTANSEAIGPADDMQNRPVALWAQVQNYRRFRETEGWDIGERESNSDDPAEVVPDMFLYWVQGYPFPPDQDNFGQARSTFMNGGNIPQQNGDPIRRITEENSTINDGSIISSAGIQSWAAKANCPSSNGVGAQSSGLTNYSEVLAANSGWCGL